jgi:hypothetical protein
MRRGMIWWSGLGSVLAIAVAITSFQFGSKDRSVLLQSQASPAPRESESAAPGSKRRKLLSNPLPPVAGFSIVSAETAGSVPRDPDLVLGVELAGESRAYVVNMMGKPESELLNDTLAGWPIAVAFCAKCCSPLVFSRVVDGETLTLYLTGELLDNNMMIRDVETGSEWVQLTGEAIAGPLEGHRLEPLPVIWTDWKTWRERYPKTTLPDLPIVVEAYRHHPLYSASPEERSLFAEMQWGLSRGETAKSWPFPQLAQHPVVNEVFAGQPLLIVFDVRTSTASAYDRRDGDTELTFCRRGRELTDTETGSQWDPILGLAVMGPLKGHRLIPIAGTVSLEEAWQKFHPESKSWSAKESSRAEKPEGATGRVNAIWY